MRNLYDFEISQEDSFTEFNLLIIQQPLKQYKSY